MERQGFTPAEVKGVMGTGQKKRMLRTTLARGGSAPPAGYFPGRKSLL